jgi:hypothetical protein
VIRQLVIIISTLLFLLLLLLSFAPVMINYYDDLDLLIIQLICQILASFTSHCIGFLSGLLLRRWLAKRGRGNSHAYSPVPSQNGAGKITSLDRLVEQTRLRVSMATASRLAPIGSVLSPIPAELRHRHHNNA